MTVPLQETQRDSEAEAIRQTALDYIEGWYTGNTERMERSLHPELAKRIVIPAANNANEDRLSQMSAMRLVQLTRSGMGIIPEYEQRKEVIILDRDGRSASAKIVASTWIDYLHLAKWEGRWVIVNVLWELNSPHA
jgi:hypothetical protein